MFGDISSFSDETKIYEERLALNPDSLLFARLAQAYLDAGRLDEALQTARQGVAKFPAFVAGQRVLALACNAKGLAGECREALERVVAAIPEDAESQKLLGRQLMDDGDNIAARRTFATVLEFFPQDAECQLELAKIDRGCLEEPAALTAGVSVLAGAAGGEMNEEEIIEDIEILEMDDADLLEEDGGDDLVAPFAGTAPSEHEDPLSTATLAELYVQQGHIDKALEIYRTVSADSHAGRIAELEAVAASTVASAATFAPAAMAAATAWQEPDPLPLPVPPVAGRSDVVVATLEGWLDNIGRIKSCR